ncbi:T9SS type A sorting domain-containing protein [Aquimarina aquimarini]|uniref:T9SS type A sorting domain-containing protein n=1 Tax=Aquimarina aquimarini TaxID=1191734 RepID=UPI00131EF621|nr:T9SS type A sorting domain-containing protein [Aquimarina aquimarini]
MSQNLVLNGDFSQYDATCDDFTYGFTNSASTNCVDDWIAYSGSPSLGGVPANPFAWMWSGQSGPVNNHYESIQTPVAFEQGKCYSVSFKVKTHDKNNQHISDHGTINLRAVNFQSGNILNEQTIFSNTIGTYLGSNWHTVTTTFTPNSNYTSLLINPLYTGGAKQAEMSIDDIVIEKNDPLSIDFHFEDTASNIRDTFCEGETVFLNGSASQGEVHYFIDARRRPTGSIGNFQYVYGLSWTSGQLQTVDLTTLFAANSINFEAGYEYEIKVALGNDCIGWLPLTKRFTVLSNVALDSDFTMNASCAQNGKITLQVTATNPNAHQWWGLFETSTSTTNGGTQVGAIQSGTTTTFSGLSMTKNYYIKHGVWKDSDKNCYPWKETRKMVPNSVSWPGYTNDFSLSLSASGGQVSVNVQADTNPVSVYHGWQVYDINHNLINGYCCNSDIASFQGLLTNKWYYIKHGVWNDCKEWRETRKYFRVQIQESRNNIGGFILETKEYPFEPDSNYTREINELVNSGAIFKLHEEYKGRILSGDTKTDTSKIEMYPNPAQVGKTLTITTSSNDRIQKIELVKLSGKSTPLPFVKQNGTIHIEISSKVSQGMYFIRITRDSGKVSTQQLAIQ